MSYITNLHYLNSNPNVTSADPHIRRWAFGNRNFHSHILSLPGVKIPPMELSLPGTFAPWYFRSMELSFPFVPQSKSDMELSLPETFVP